MGRARSGEDLGAGSQGGSRCDYVIHEQDPAGGRRGRPEGPHQVDPPVLSGESRLVRDPNRAPQKGAGREPKGGCDSTPQELGMVEASPSFIGPGARGPGHCIRRGAGAMEGLDESVDQWLGAGPASAELEPEHEVPNHPLVPPHRIYVIEAGQFDRSGSPDLIEASHTSNDPGGPAPNTPNPDQGNQRTHAWTLRRRCDTPTAQLKGAARWTAPFRNSCSFRWGLR